MEKSLHLVFVRRLRRLARSRPQYSFQAVAERVFVYVPSGGGGWLDLKRSSRRLRSERYVNKSK